MKNQHMRAGSVSLPVRLLFVLAILVALVGCIGVVVSADNGDTRPVANVKSLKFDENVVKMENGYYCKEYDGTTAVAVTAETDAAGVTLVATAEFDSKDVQSATKITIRFTLTGENADQYQAPAPIEVAARIVRAQLSWTTGGSVSVPYDPEKTTQTVTVPAGYVLDTSKIPAGETITVTGAALELEMTGATGSTPLKRYATVTATAGVGTNLDNYAIPALPVSVTITPVEIVSISWSKPAYSFVYGDKEIYEITVVGKDASGKTYDLRTVIADASGVLSLEDAAAKGLYGQVKRGETETTYVVTVALPDASNYTFAAGISDLTRGVAIRKALYTVSLGNQIYIMEGRLTASDSNKIAYRLLVSGTGIPSSVYSEIIYTYTKADGTVTVGDGVDESGIYTVKAKLPSGVSGDFENFAFVDANGNEITTLTATMIVKSPYLSAGSSAYDSFQFILVSENGISPSVKLEVSVPTELNKKALHAFRVHKEYTIKLTGAEEGETYQLLIPVYSAFVAEKNCEPLTDADLYVYDSATGTMSAMKDSYSIRLSEDGTHYIIDNFGARGELTMVMAPKYNAPFWVTIPGIFLIILLVVAVLALLFLIGLRLRRLERSGKNPVLVIDTEGELPVFEPVTVEDKIEDVDACLNEGIDTLAENLSDEVEAASEEENANAEGTEQAVSEAMEDLSSELSQIQLENENAEETTEEDTTADELADQIAENLSETTEAEKEETEADDTLVAAAVAEAIAENFNESADATDAVALITEEEELSPESFRDVVDAIVAESMAATMVLPEEEEITEETPAEETTEETPAEETTEETPAEETTEEAPAEETTEEEEPDICAVVADSVAEAFEAVTVDGVVPEAVEGTTIATITEAVDAAGKANIPDSWTEDMADAVKAAVVDELAARLLPAAEEVPEEPAEEPVEEPAEEPAVETVAEVTEETETDEEGAEDDENEENEEENESFGGFGSMPLDFIDVIAEAEKYNDMLEQERRGEVQLVTRYRRSFQSRMIQSQGNVQEYYNQIKNLLLSYKGIKNRISWNYESFNLGRTHVAKINAKTKTLYLYMALNPEDLADSKYAFVDVSSKKKYATVPVLMKVKGDRKFKHTLELITKLCEEQLQLPKKKNFVEEDYRIPYKTNDELVEEGMIRKLVAAIPMELINRGSEDSSEITMVAPNDAPATEAPFDGITETPAEETQTANAPATETTETAEGEIPASAEASDETSGQTTGETSEDTPKEV